MDMMVDIQAKAAWSTRSR